jgi:hypothetical protein
MPIKIAAVQAVRGGVPFLGEVGTWLLGAFWILFCFSCKLVAIYVDRKRGVIYVNGDGEMKTVSYRKVFQAHFCSFEGMGLSLLPQDYQTSTSPIPLLSGDVLSLGKTIRWQSEAEGCPMHTKLVRDGSEPIFGENGFLLVAKNTEMIE